MSVQPINAQVATSRWTQATSTSPGLAHGFDCVIDVRSPGEFALDHWPGALNWPVLDDEQRALVGTLYKQSGAFEAQKTGAALVAANIAKHIQAHVMDKPKNWQPLIYCWRGGKRSGSLSLVLSQIGFKVHLLEGGYKAFRQEVIATLPQLLAPLQLQVIAGPTGSGKTKLLHALKAQGAQVLDLEELAKHKSSVLGFTPNQAQPSQKHFDTLIWEQVLQFDPKRVVYVESESKKVGNLTVPEALIERMRGSPCHWIELDLSWRVALLMQDYPHFVSNASLFKQKLQALVALRGGSTVQGWCHLIDEGRTSEVVQSLLELHYDPTYLSSMKKNFLHLPQAHRHVLTGIESADFAQLAQRLLAT